MNEPRVLKSVQFQNTSDSVEYYNNKNINKTNEYRLDHENLKGCSNSGHFINDMVFGRERLDNNKTKIE